MYRIEVQTGPSEFDAIDFTRTSNHEFSDLKEAIDFFNDSNLEFLDGSALDGEHFVEVSYDERYSRKVIFYYLKELLPTIGRFNYSLNGLISFPKDKIQEKPTI